MNDRQSAASSKAALLHPLAIAALSLVACQAPAAQSEKAGDYNHMEELRVPGLDKVYRRQGADLSRYTSVIVDEPAVSFRENWRLEDESSAKTPALPDLPTVRQRLSQEFRRVLTAKLAENGGYPIATAPGSNVLQVKAELTELYISSSAIESAAGVKPYSMDLSEVTLVMELRDATTGALLYRAYDHWTTRDQTTVQLNNGTWSSPALQKAIDYWATFLRQSLDQMKSGKRL